MFWPLLLLPLIPTFFRFLVACHVSLINLRSAEDYAILPFSPTDLSVADVVLVVCLFIGRSIRKAFGYGRVGSLRTSPQQKDNKSISQVTSSQRADKDDIVYLQRLELAMPLHIRSPDIAQYIKAISSTPTAASSSKDLITKHQYTSDILTADLAHLTLFLSAISEPALLLLLARKGCPVEPLGSVNARNHFELLRPDLCKQIIKEAELIPAKTQLSTGTDEGQNFEKSVLASLPPTARAVKRGIEIDITISIYARVRNLQSQTWGPNVEVFRQIFTVLQFTSSSSSSPSSSSSSSLPSKSPSVNPSTPIKPSSPSPPSIPPPPSSISLLKTDPLEWAKLCKDYNPIHISSFAAKAFGFRGVIAHGNHVVAKALTTFTEANPLSSMHDRRDGDVELEADREKKRNGEEGEEKGIYIDVSFRRPVLVPSQVGVRQVEMPEKGRKRDNDGRVKVEVFKDDKISIEIEMGRLDTVA